MKNFLQNLKIIKKIILAPSIGILLIIGCWLVAFQGMEKLNYVVKDFFHKRFFNYTQSAILLDRTINNNNNLYKIILWVDKGFDQKRIDNLITETKKELSDITIEIESKLKQVDLTNDQEEILKKAKLTMSNYKSDVENIISNLSTDVNAAIMFAAGIDTDFVQLKGLLQQLVDYENNLSTQLFSIAQKNHTKYATFSLIILINAVLALIFISRFMAKVITAPIFNLKEKLKLISKGDLTIGLDLKINDEIGELASSASEMMNTIRKITSSLENERNNIANLLNNMQQAIFIVNENGVIIPPVSSYTKEIFKQEDIIGKNIFDTLYKDIKKESELYSIINNIWQTVYGENNIQWMVIEDNLPTEIEYYIDSKIKKKLKVRYVPLWNKSDLLEAIMLVIEDITVIEILEKKINQEKHNNLKRVTILQQLAAQSNNIIKEFLINSIELVDQVYNNLKTKDHIKNLNNDSYLNILSKLHTLKGNARVLGFTYLSETIHNFESYMQNNRTRIINEFVNENDSIIMQNTHQEFEYQIEMIFIQLMDYSNNAEKIFRIKLNFKQILLLTTHKNYLSLLSYFVDINNIKLKSSVLNFKNLIEIIIKKLKENTTKLGSLEAKEVLNLISKDIRALYDNPINHDYSQIISLFKRLNTIIKNFFISNISIDYGNYNTDYVLNLFSQIYEISNPNINCGHNEPNKNILPSEILDALVKLSKSSEDCFLSTPYILIKSYLDKQKDNRDSDVKTFENLLHQLWHYIAIILFIDVGTGKHLLSDKTNDNNNSNKFNNFLAMIAKHINISSSNINSHFCIKNNTSDFFENLLSKIKIFDFTSSIKNNLHNLQLPEIFFKLYDKFAFNELLSYSLLTDIYMLFYLTDKKINSSNLQSIEMEEVIKDNLDDFKNTLNTIYQKRITDQDIKILKQKGDLLFEVPLITILANYKEMINDLSTRLMKKAILQIDGSNISLDRQKLNMLCDCVTHILRNSIDHGIEHPAIRLQKGKNEYGLIKINLTENNQNKVITISDDGQGLNSEKILQKAKIINANLYKTSDTEISDLEANTIKEIIFQPEFSTADKVSELSGRGIGLSIVKNKIEEMGGKIDVNSTSNLGTTFMITLPKMS
ncbi:MAG: Hpt domain-containing protein [Oligoflexia bacterium]|nr:Hpt domain-containing protein [Oligoflexia bacterium]